MEETAFMEPYNLNRKTNRKNKKPSLKTPTCSQNTVLYFCNFCDNTSIHGFKFIGERNRTFFEKIFWFIVLIGATSSSSYLIYRTYKQWSSSPIIVSFAMTETPIWEVPFPAVTICSEVNANSSVFNYTDVYLKYSIGLDTTEDEDYYFNLYSLLCNENLDFINTTETQFITMADLKVLSENFGYSGIDTCKWLGSETDCDTILADVITQEGWCSTFNMLAYDDLYQSDDDESTVNNKSKSNTKKLKAWSLEDGYPRNVGLDTYPHRTMISGVNGGLQIDFEVDDEHLDYLCSELQGYKVTLHHPAEDPDMTKYFRVPLDQVVLAAIKPRMITTSEEIISYNAIDRQCYMPGEKVLPTYKIYTQQNCLFDCLANFTLSKCGCSLYYITANETLCGAGSKECVNKAKVDFLQEDLNFKLHNKEKEADELCDCLPSCTSLEYDVETSQSDWNWRRVELLKSYANDSDFDYLNKMKYKSRLTVYFKDLQFMTSQRHELYGTIDFLGNCGGLLGLCCGFSFTSLIEIIYYLTVRLYSNISKFGYKIWSGSEELIEDEKKQ